jgi:hypothetical protein
MYEIETDGLELTKAALADGRASARPRVAIRFSGALPDLFK